MDGRLRRGGRPQRLRTFSLPFSVERLTLGPPPFTVTEDRRLDRRDECTALVPSKSEVNSPRRLASAFSSNPDFEGIVRTTSPL